MRHQKYKKIFLIYILSLLFLTVFLTGCGFIGKEEVYYPKPKFNHTTSKTEDLITVVMRGDVREEKTLTLFAKPVNETDLSFAVSGIKYDTFFVSPGDKVKKGQVLARLYCEDYVTLKQQAQSQLARVNAELKKQWPLFEQYAMSKAEYERSVADLSNQIQVLNEQIKEYDAYINDRTIYADIDGIVKNITDVEPLECSQEGKIMISLVSGEKIFTTTTPELAGLEVGNIYNMNANDTIVEVKLDSAEQENGQYKLSFVLASENTDATDIDRGKINYISYEMNNQLYVDQSGVSKVGDTYYVYYLANGSRQVKEVKVGPLVNGCYIIEDGVKEGEELLCN